MLAAEGAAVVISEVLVDEGATLADSVAFTLELAR